jgi:hypothetical protein
MNDVKIFHDAILNFSVFYHLYKYLCLKLFSCHFFQSYHQGTDGPTQPGPISAVQHPSSADPGSVHPASLDSLLADHAWIRISSHCCCTHSSSCKLIKNFIVFQNKLECMHP